MDTRKIVKPLRMSFILYGITLTLTIMGSAPAHAFPIQRSLPEMVQLADFIIIGEPIKLEKVGMTMSGGTIPDPEFEATIEVEQVIKGVPGTKTVEVSYGPYSGRARFDLAQRSVYFLKRSGARLLVVARSSGEISIEDKWVKPTGILGEMREQRLDEFLGKIEAILEREQ